MTKVFTLFVLLQLADLGTTAAAIMLGGSEQNPVIHHFMAVGPMAGVLLGKMVALAIGTGCLFGNKYRALRIANLFFTGIVVWNLTILFRLTH